MLTQPYSKAYSPRRKARVLSLFKSGDGIPVPYSSTEFSSSNAQTTVIEEKGQIIVSSCLIGHHSNSLFSWKISTGELVQIPFNDYLLERIASKFIGTYAYCSVKLAYDSRYEKWLEITDSSSQSSCLVKIPFPNVAFYRVENEVHTIDFLCQNTTIPLPRILSYSSSSQTPVGIEYIIFDHPFGTPLDEIWNHLSSSERKGYILQVIDLKIQTLSLTSDKIGSIYMKNTYFAVGPLLSFLERGLPDCGPWHTLKHYIHSLSMSYLLYLKSIKATSSRHFPSNLAKAAIKKFLKIAPFIQPPEHLCKFVLHHPDLSLSNIYVCDGRISCITGWSSSSFQPFFEAVQPPKCLMWSQDEDKEAMHFRKLYYDRVQLEIKGQFTSPRVDFFRQLLDLISRHGSPKDLSCAIVDIVEHWSIICSDSRIDCPITVSKCEKKKTLRCESLPAVSEIIFDSNRWKEKERMY